LLELFKSGALPAELPFEEDASLLSEFEESPEIKPESRLERPSERPSDTPRRAPSLAPLRAPETSELHPDKINNIDSTAATNVVIINFFLNIFVPPFILISLMDGEAICKLSRG
jgi:hypothetical protein